MLDLVGLLTSPRIFLCGVVGVLAGIGAAWLIRFVAGPQVPTEVLALVVAVGIVAGLFIGSRWEARQ
jgi:hypothetical protein